MPAVIPFIPLIVGAVSAGTSIFEAVNRPSAPKPQAPEAPKPPDQTAEKEALITAAPSVQERLGGSVAPEFFASEVARVSGNPQDTELAKQVLSSYLGLGSSPDKQGTGSTNFGGGESFVAPQSNIASKGGPGFFEGLMGGGGGYGGGEGHQEFSGGYS